MVPIVRRVPCARAIDGGYPGVSSMPASVSERDLLFGLLAFQTGLVELFVQIGVVPVGGGVPEPPPIRLPPPEDPRGRPRWQYERPFRARVLAYR